MNRTALCLVVTAIIAITPSSRAQSTPGPLPVARLANEWGLTPDNSAPQPPTTIDGGVGPCSLEVTVKTADGKPAAASSVKVHIAYGFGGFHKLDLEAGANADGQVKFTGLPSRVRRPPLEFDAKKGDLVGTTTYDPATECHAKREIKLAKPNASGN